jgi:HSP20 family molecular chaperone IbpA
MFAEKAIQIEEDPQQLLTVQTQREAEKRTLHRQLKRKCRKMKRTTRFAVAADGRIVKSI